MNRASIGLSLVLFGLACTGAQAQEPTPSNTSISPDKRWEYRCQPYGLDQCSPEIVEAGTDDLVLDLDQELSVYGPDARKAQVVWAPDSKRFACNYSPLHAHHTTYVVVAFYQLEGDKWVALKSASDEASSRLQLAQLGKGHLPKDFNPANCSKNRDELKVLSWREASRAIVFAPCYQRASDANSGFLFTLKFDDAGKWEIIETHRMSKKELEEAEGSG